MNLFIFQTQCSPSRILKVTVGSMIALFIGFLLYFDILPVLSLATLEKHHARFLIFINHHYALAVFLYVGLFSLLKALSVPGGLVLTFAAGYFFGTVPGAMYVLLGASAGAALAFLGTRYLFQDLVLDKLGTHVPAFQETVKTHAFITLLVLRLFPFVPFTLLNLLAGLTPMKFTTFLGATMIGILPCTFVLSYIGSRLPHISALFNMDSSFLVVPLTGLAFLALVSLACQYGISQGKLTQAEASSLGGVFPQSRLNPFKPLPPTRP
ncbi:MAG TPA: hypothetical protein DD706_16960 [Nitrospiraceae bacterium]|nr:hypothetical protein [Nitrospiraceae bacterium]